MMALRQNPYEDKGAKLRRAVISIDKRESAHARLPMVDYAETDIDRRPMTDLNQNLNWILLNTYFAVAFFFLVPGLIFAACLSAILDNYFYLQKLLYFFRCPDSWYDHNPSENSSKVSTEPKVPTIAGASRAYNLALPVIALPFAMIYYTKIVNPWFPTILHHVLFLVAIEHVLVLLHWSITQLTESSDRNIAEDAARDENSFSRVLKKQALAKKYQTDLEDVIDHAVRSKQSEMASEIQRLKNEGDVMARLTQGERFGIAKELEKTITDLRNHYFEPKSLRANLQYSIYWSIEQYLLSKRLETVGDLVKMPICEENCSYQSKFYLPKRKSLLILDEEFISGEECQDFMIKRGSDHHEKVSLPLLETKVENAELTLTEYLVLKNDPEYSSKFELYHRKDKLQELLEEYLRRKGEEEFLKNAQKVSFWVKLQNCELSIPDIDSAFELFENIYHLYIGFQDNIDPSETNPNKMLLVEVNNSQKDTRKLEGSR